MNRQFLTDNLALPGLVLQVLILLALLGPFIAFFLMPGAGLIVPRTPWVGLLLILSAVGIVGLMLATLEAAAKR